MDEQEIKKLVKKFGVEKTADIIQETARAAGNKSDPKSEIIEKVKKLAN